MPLLGKLRGNEALLTGRAASLRLRHPPLGLLRETEGCVLFPRLMFVAAIVLAAMAMAIDARAADAGNGKRLADSHCASCHVVAPQARSEVADAPPFDVIGRKYGFDAGAIAHAIVGPHPKMNFSPRPAEAADLAAYMATLGQ